MIQWSDPLSYIHGLTARERRSLSVLGVATVGELLSIFPRRYDDYSRIVPLAKTPLGAPVTVRVRIREIKQAPTFRRGFSLIRAVVEDDSGVLPVTWFNQPWLIKRLTPGTEIFVSGVVTHRPRFGIGFTSPLWEPATDDTLLAGVVAPVYPLSGSLGQKTVRRAIKLALEEVELPSDSLPPHVIEQSHVLPLSAAYRALHRPVTSEEAEQARCRFAFEELFIYQLALRLARREADQSGAPLLAFDEAFAKTFAVSLPFALTEDQKKAIWAAIKEMQTGRPMRRLLQGDVGSGKTVVAAMLAALSFRGGASAIIMAPTDLLARQHAETMRRFLIPHQIPVGLVTGSARLLIEGGEEKTLAVQDMSERIQAGRIVLVGTHALLERGQAPPDLLLAVVDEQHRFGVAQREALMVSSRSDGRVPHLLSMSATPIPRSLALTMLGDLEVSTIKMKPVGRVPIVTRVLMGEEGREEAYDRLRDEVAQGRRAFIICPLIEVGDMGVGVKNVESEYRRLVEGPLRMLRVGMVHGGMTAKARNAEMKKFVDGELDVLVATTVVEVGVDVPQATVMLIEGAERFGLAQLHQLRGRIGRGSHPSWCFLLSSDGAGPVERLRVLERTSDGFEIAEEDLRLRGEGHLLGMQQSGQAIFKAARMDDLALMTKARDCASEILMNDVTLAAYPALATRVHELRETSHRE
jgi:ATP-dependent DNA helicase RecG